VILLRPANWAKHSFGPWLMAAAKRLHHNVLATALANKLARIAWTVLAQRRNYETRVMTVAAWRSRAPVAEVFGDERC
jgi:transposase